LEEDLPSDPPCLPLLNVKSVIDIVEGGFSDKGEVIMPNYYFVERSGSVSS